MSYLELNVMNDTDLQFAAVLIFSVDGSYTMYIGSAVLHMVFAKYYRTSSCQFISAAHKNVPFLCATGRGKNTDMEVR